MFTHGLRVTATPSHVCVPVKTDAGLQQLTEGRQALWWYGTHTLGSFWFNMHQRNFVFSSYSLNSNYICDSCYVVFLCIHSSIATHMGVSLQWHFLETQNIWQLLGQRTFKWVWQQENAKPNLFDSVFSTKEVWDKFKWTNNIKKNASVANVK